MPSISENKSYIQPEIDYNLLNNTENYVALCPNIVPNLSIDPSAQHFFDIATLTGVIYNSLGEAGLYTNLAITLGNQLTQVSINSDDSNQVNALTFSALGAAGANVSLNLTLKGIGYTGLTLAALEAVVTLGCCFTLTNFLYGSARFNQTIQSWTSAFEFEFDKANDGKILKISAYGQTDSQIMDFIKYSGCLTYHKEDVKIYVDRGFNQKFEVIRDYSLQSIQTELSNRGFYSDTPEAWTDLIKEYLLPQNPWLSSRYYDATDVYGAKPFLLLEEGEKILFPLIGNEHDNKIYGPDESSLLKGNGGNDTIHGGSQNDSIQGDIGADYIVGGEGNDSLEGGTGHDTYVFNTGDGIDTINDTNETPLLPIEAASKKGQVQINGFTAYIGNLNALILNNCKINTLEIKY